MLVLTLQVNCLLDRLGDEANRLRNYKLITLSLEPLSPLEGVLGLLARLQKLESVVNFSLSVCLFFCFSVSCTVFLILFSGFQFSCSW